MTDFNIFQLTITLHFACKQASLENTGLIHKDFVLTSTHSLTCVNTTCINQVGFLDWPKLIICFLQSQ